MRVLFGKVTAHCRTAVPGEICDLPGVKAGDVLVHRIDGDRVTLARAEPLDRSYLKAAESTLSEWESAEDAAAYDDL